MGRRRSLKRSLKEGMTFLGWWGEVLTFKQFLGEKSTPKVLQENLGDLYNLKHARCWKRT